MKKIAVVTTLTSIVAHCSRSQAAIQTKHRSGYTLTKSLLRRKDSLGGVTRLQQCKVAIGVAHPVVPPPSASPILHCLQPKGSPSASAYHSGSGRLQNTLQTPKERTLQQMAVRPFKGWANISCSNCSFISTYPEIPDL